MYIHTHICDDTHPPKYTTAQFHELSPRAYHSIFGGGADDGNEGEEVELASPDEVLGRLRAAGLVPAAAAEAEKGQQALLFIPQVLS